MASRCAESQSGSFKQITSLLTPPQLLQSLCLILFDFAGNLARAARAFSSGRDTSEAPTAPAPNHINLASRGRLSRWLLAAYHHQLKSASSCRIFKDVRESGSARVGQFEGGSFTLFLNTEDYQDKNDRWWLEARNVKRTKRRNCPSHWAAFIWFTPSKQRVPCSNHAGRAKNPIRRHAF